MDLALVFIGLHLFQLSNGSSRTTELCAELERIREERELRQFFATIDELMESNADQQRRAFDLLKRREHNVRNPISSKCYKTFTGLYLQVCKYRAIFNNTCSHEYCQIHDAYARQLSIWYLKVNIGINIWK